MNVKGILNAKNFQAAALFLLLLACGCLAFNVFSHYFPLFNSPEDGLGRVALCLLLLLIAVLLRRSPRLNKYWLIPLAYFIALTAISIDFYLALSHWILPSLNVPLKTPAGLAIDKLESSLLGIFVVLLLNAFAGQNLQSLYIRRGNLRLGLVVGLAAFALMTAGLIPVTEQFFNGKDLTWFRILTWSPWLLIMVFSNAAYEELVFRGLLIGKIEPFLGRWTTNLVTTIPFVILHAGNNYMSNEFIFLALQLLPLSLAWCWLMQRTNSIWGSILFHAAMDLPVFVGIFSRI